MMLEFKVTVPFGDENDLEMAMRHWFKYLNKTMLFRFNSKSIKKEIPDVENECFIWHIFLKDNDKEKVKNRRLGSFTKVVMLNNVLVRKSIDNKVSSKIIKRKLRKNGMDEEKINEALEDIKLRSGGTLERWVEDDKYDFDKREFKEELE